ncbi:glycosyltransferase family 2 protein [Microvirga flavescens]|uniref:glycosyltransferase family 2 protein n=1 Tax=Microvirga flavescens TaxID=2249811 RepID=UPI001FE058C9|nr:glycosyltransferase family 2 protein [Microvirga flavescens]
MPTEIGFLAAHGVPSGLLQDAATIAAITGVSADRVLIAHGLVTEEAFYRALAHELGVPFISHPKVSPKASYPHSILSGIVPLAQVAPAYALTPRGSQIAQLLHMRPSRGRPIALTTSSALMRAVFAIQRKGIAHQAAHGLSARYAHLSNHVDIGAPQIALLSLAAFAVSFTLVAASERAVMALASLMSPLFFGNVTLRLAAAFLPSSTSSSLLEHAVPDAQLPTYTVIAALYREECVAPRLVSALSRLDYPPEKLDIKLVLEEDDAQTRAVLEALDLPGFMEVIIAPPGAPRTKPRALNVALPLARGALTVLYDAEDVPEPNQLRLAAAAFARASAETACFQAHLTIDNTKDNWLTRLFTLEYAILFDVINPGLVEVGCPIPLGGTSNHFRTEALRKVGGWDAWNVTEDADLGIRLARFGMRVGDLPSSTLEEAPSTLSAWMLQRTRWMKGFIQTCYCHSRNPWRIFRELGPWRFIGTLIVSAGTVVTAFGYPLFMALALNAWLNDPGVYSDTIWIAALEAWSSTLFLVGLMAIAIPALVAIKRRRLWGLLPWVPLLPVYYLFISLAAWRSLWELVSAPFQWNKTRHGLARTSRSGLL